MINVNALPLEGEGGLIDLLKTLVDPRKPRGVRHPVVTVVGIAVCAALSGARSFCAIGEWAQGLTREALQRLGSKRWTPPSEPTIRRVLQGLDANRLDAQIGQWVARQQLRPGVAVAVDGKSLRRSHEAGQAGSPPAERHPAPGSRGRRPDGRGRENQRDPQTARLARSPAAGRAPWSRPMPCTRKRKRPATWWKRKKADYLFIAKDNQPTLRQDIADLHLESIPPSAHHDR